MFIGHYGPAYAIKRWRPGIPIFALFIAVQLVDVAWAVLVTAGIEKVRIVPGITATNPLDLYYMPYTHGLISALLWAALAGIAYGLASQRVRWGPFAFAIGVAVFSHWILDLVVHRPDLPLYDDSAKVGLGLWNYPLPALALEIGVLVAGLWLYVSGSRSRDRIGRFGPWVMVALLIGVQLMAFFGRPPDTPVQAAMMGLGSYVVLAFVAAWIDRHRAWDYGDRSRATT